MNKDTYVFRKNYSDKEGIKLNLIGKLNSMIKVAAEDFQVTIEQLSKRSKNALAAYFVLIDSVVKWHPKYCAEHGGTPYGKSFWREWFEREAGLTEEVNMLPIWKMRYKKELASGDYEIFYWADDDSYCLQKKDFDGEILKSLGGGLEIKTRSISNKGDVTKEEMERLIFCILDFGKPENNNIPGCKIIDDDLSRLLKFCEGK